MRLVEQQQARVARQRDSEREPAPLAGREATVRDVARADEADALERPRRRRRRRRPAARAANRRFSRDGEVVVAEGLVADERELAAGRRAGRGRGRGRARSPRPSTAEPAPPAAGAAWSCRRRSRPRAARPRPRPRRGRPRPAPGSDPGGRRRSGDGRQAHSPPGDRWPRVYGRSPGAVEPARRAAGARDGSVTLHAMRTFLGATGRVLVTGGILSCSSSPTSSGEPGPAGPGAERARAAVRAQSGQADATLVVLDVHHGSGCTHDARAADDRAAAAPSPRRATCSRG